MRVERARKSLRDKGFQEKPGNHYRFHYYHDGRKTHVHTMFSHGRQISEYDLNCMRGQLRLLDMKQLDRLLSCDMRQDEYHEYLHSQGVLPR